MSADKLLRQATALARAVAYKKGIDTKVKSDEEIAIESNQTLLYETLKHDNPRLYKELQEEILRIKHKVKGGTANDGK